MSMWIEKAIQNIYQNHAEDVYEVMISSDSGALICGIVNGCHCVDQASSLKLLFEFFPVQLENYNPSCHIFEKSSLWLWFLPDKLDDERRNLLFLDEHFDLAKKVIQKGVERYASKDFGDVLILPSPSTVFASEFLKKTFWDCLKNHI